MRASRAGAARRRAGALAPQSASVVSDAADDVAAADHLAAADDDAASPDDAIAAPDPIAAADVLAPACDDDAATFFAAARGNPRSARCDDAARRVGTRRYARRWRSRLGGLAIRAIATARVARVRAPRQIGLVTIFEGAEVRWATSA